MKKLTLFLLICLLAACSQDEKPNENLPSTTPEITAVAPTLAPEIRQNYEQGFEQLRQLHGNMDEVWGAISRGETAQCGTAYEVISPERFSGDDPIAAALHTASVELADAARLWEAECNNPRAEIPSDVIDRGLRMVLTAGDALNEAENLLIANR